MASPQQPRPQSREAIFAPSSDLAALPERVRAMRALILEAVEAGDIEDLRRAIERNETLPIFATGPGRPRTFADAVSFLKKQAFDRHGRETLSIIAAIFQQPYRKIARGPVVVYEWPAFAGKPGDDERREMWRCMRFARISSAGETAPACMRIGIGADGVWHYFVAPD